MKIGAHLDYADLDGDHGLPVAQIFLSSPLKIVTPKTFPPNLAQEMDVYVHAPFVMNPASDKPNIRSFSLHQVKKELRAAAESGAKALIVHSGSSENVNDYITRWAEFAKKLAEYGVLDLGVELLVENSPATKGNDPKTLMRVHEETGFRFCFDTCHAWVSGHVLHETNGFYEMPDPGHLFDAFLDLPIAFVHANGAKHSCGSRRDGHINVKDETLFRTDIIEVIKEIGAPAVVETPDPLEDARWLTAEIGAQAENSGKEDVSETVDKTEQL